MTWFRDVVVIVAILVLAGYFVEIRFKKIIKEELARIWPDDKVD